MSLDSRIVADTYTHLLGISLDDLEADEVAAALGSREELLASLVVLKKAFGEGISDLRALMSAAANQHVETKTPRKDLQDFTRVVAARRRASEAIAQLVESQKTSHLAAREVSESFRELVRLEPAGPQHPGFRWRVHSEQ